MGSVLRPWVVKKSSTRKLTIHFSPTITHEAVKASCRSTPWVLVSLSEFAAGANNMSTLGREQSRSLHKTVFREGEFLPFTAFPAFPTCSGARRKSDHRLLLLVHRSRLTGHGALLTDTLNPQSAFKQKKTRQQCRRAFV